MAPCARRSPKRARSRREAAAGPGEAARASAFPAPCLSAPAAAGRPRVGAGEAPLTGPPPAAARGHRQPATGLAPAPAGPREGHPPHSAPGPPWGPAPRERSVNRDGGAAGRPAAGLARAIIRSCPLSSSADEIHLWEAASCKAEAARPHAGAGPRAPGARAPSVAAGATEPCAEPASAAGSALGGDELRNRRAVASSERPASQAVKSRLVLPRSPRAKAAAAGRRRTASRPGLGPGPAERTVQPSRGVPCRSAVPEHHGICSRNGVLLNIEGALGPGAGWQPPGAAFQGSLAAGGQTGRGEGTQRYRGEGAGGPARPGRGRGVGASGGAAREMPARGSHGGRRDGKPPPVPHSPPPPPRRRRAARKDTQVVLWRREVCRNKPHIFLPGKMRALGYRKVNEQHKCTITVQQASLMTDTKYRPAAAHCFSASFKPEDGAGSWASNCPSGLARPVRRHRERATGPCCWPAGRPGLGAAAPGEPRSRRGYRGRPAGGSLRFPGAEGPPAGAGRRRAAGPDTLQCPRGSVLATGHCAPAHAYRRHQPGCERARLLPYSRGPVYRRGLLLEGRLLAAGA
ncbi:translation initiation factor IF-2-like [Falco peregrinus]|uniref:translation initiation factor IF-2-like n=1 Tax=Falco peregrinus TaxID=8954 RepID=UPI002479F50B|nr:translation initiation factor IF-2-like [Falco peregrinus]